MALTEVWTAERRWLASIPTWLLLLYTVQIARLAGVPWQHEEFTRRLLAARHTAPVRRRTA